MSGPEALSPREGRRAVERALAWPLTEERLVATRRLVAAGHRPGTDAWAAFLAAAPPGCDRRLQALRRLRALVEEAALDGWMLRPLYELGRRAAAEADEGGWGSTAPDVVRAAVREQASALIADTLYHPAADEGLWARFGHHVATHDGTAYEGVDDVAWKATGDPEGPFARAACVEAMMAHGTTRYWSSVIRLAPSPWPVRMFRRLAREAPEKAAAVLAGEPVGHGGRRHEAARERLLGELGRDDLAALLADGAGPVRAAALVTLGAIEGAEGEARSVGEEERASQLARAFERADWDRWRRLRADVAGRCALGYERALALYGTLEDHRPHDRMEGCRLLLAEGWRPDPGTWERIVDPSGHGVPARQHYRRLRPLVEQPACTSWMLEAVWRMARVPAHEVDGEERPSRYGCPSSQPILMERVLHHPNAGEGLRARAGHEMGLDEGGRAGTSLFRLVLAASGEGEAGWSDPVRSDAFCRAALASDGIRALWSVLERARPRWARAAFRRLAREAGLRLAGWLGEQEAGSELQERWRGMLTPADLAPLMDHERAAVREAGVAALGRLCARGGRTR